MKTCELLAREDCEGLRSWSLRSRSRATAKAVRCLRHQSVFVLGIEATTTVGQFTRLQPANDDAFDANNASGNRGAWLSRDSRFGCGLRGNQLSELGRDICHRIICSVQAASRTEQRADIAESFIRRAMHDGNEQVTR